MGLSDKKCVPCKGGVPPLTAEQIKPLHDEVMDWEVIDSKRLKRKLKTKNFAESLNLVNRIGALAEQEGHHPGISFGWGYLTVEIWTHKIDGLTESDFILAAKIDALIPKP